MVRSAQFLIALTISALAWGAPNVECLNLEQVAAEMKKAAAAPKNSWTWRVPLQIGLAGPNPHGRYVSSELRIDAILDQAKKFNFPFKGGKKHGFAECDETSGCMELVRPIQPQQVQSDPFQLGWKIEQTGCNSVKVTRAGKTTLYKVSNRKLTENEEFETEASGLNENKLILEKASGEADMPAIITAATYNDQQVSLSFGPSKYKHVHNCPQGKVEEVQSMYTTFSYSWSNRSSAHTISPGGLAEMASMNNFVKEGAEGSAFCRYHFARKGTGGSEAMSDSSHSADSTNANEGH